jgi:hypothetical protein
MMATIYGEVDRKPGEPRRFAVRKGDGAVYAITVAELLLQLVGITKDDFDKAFEEKATA